MASPGAAAGGTDSADGLWEPLVDSSDAYSPAQDEDDGYEENLVTASYHPGDSVRPLSSIHCKNEHYGTAVLSATSTLGLGCLGSSVLPMPYAFSKTGVLIGVVLMVVVAYANALTARMLLSAAAATHTDTYEGCAKAVGGKPWKVWAQLTLLALLFGSTCGAVSLFRDVAKIILGYIQPAPQFLGVEGSLTIQIFLVVGLVLPLCLLKDIRSVGTDSRAVLLNPCGPIHQSFPGHADSHPLCLWLT
mmetsp:Transcript_39042/g.110585  ORF Transcript_39042/g.110585 Transcript_39042/m.110585 type:complete len:247 (+) Transcript_39042:181-921(+)